MIFNLDGWRNILTGLNIFGKDKILSGVPTSIILKRGMADELLASDAIATKIVERIPKDGTREWIEFKNIDQEIQEELNVIIKKLNLKTLVRQAWIDARLYGGAAFILNVDDRSSNFDEPLNLRTLRSVNSLVLMNRYELQANTTDLEEDLASPNFGLPEFYDLTPEGSSAKNFKIHNSRLIRFEGEKLPVRLFINNQFWNDSVLSKLFNTLSRFNQSHDALSQIIIDFRISVLKLKNLFQAVSAGKDKAVQKRLELIQETKSNMSMMLLGNEDEFQQVTHSMQGVKDVMSEIDKKMVADSGYPHTILLGESPSGLGATGESELRDYYDTVGQEQETVIRRPLETIFNLIFLSKDGPTGGKIPEKFEFDFKPIFKLTEESRAKMELDVASKDKIYIENGVLDPDEVVNSRYGGKDFSQDTIVDPIRLKEIQDQQSGDPTETEEEEETQI